METLHEFIINTFSKYGVKEEEINRYVTDENWTIRDATPEFRKALSIQDHETYKKLIEDVAEKEAIDNGWVYIDPNATNREE